MKLEHFREMPKGPPPALQPKPTLTDAEREAIEAAIVGRLELGDFATLRTLLERIK